MFGTLVIQLPSNYTGGQLVVYHQSKSEEFDFGGPAGCTAIHYAAFYADCEHEIKPVKTGYRLCLIYNLVYKGPRPSNCYTPPDNEQNVSVIIRSMQEWGIHSGESPLMMTYLCEHQYCDSSLSFQLLKNSDRAVADVLAQATKEVEFDMYLAKVSLVEQWSDDDYEMFDDEIRAENLTSLKGYTISSIDLKKKYLVPDTFFDERDPDDEESKPYTGNEVAHVEKQYNWAALLLWPSINRVRNLGIDNTIHVLEKDLQARSISLGKKAELEVIVRCIFSECTSPSHWRDSESFFLLLRCLQSLGKVELISKFLDVIATSLHSCLIGNSSFGNEVLAIGLKYGWDTLRSPLQTIFNGLHVSLSSNEAIEEYCEFLYRISLLPSSEVQKDICHGLANITVTMLSNEPDAHPKSCDLISLFKCLEAALCDKQLLTTLIEVVTAKPNCYPVLETLVPVCDGLHKLLNGGIGVNKSLEALLVYCITSLEVSSSRVIPIPTNWSQPVALSCSCIDCKKLRKFLEHPTKTECKFCFTKSKALHLETQLNENHCSVITTMECTYGFYDMVVSKTRNYERDCQIFEKEKEALSHLQSMSATISSFPSVVNYGASYSPAS